ncbi:hypothetical protein [Candidatus Nitrosocosmicus sp. R]
MAEITLVQRTVEEYRTHSYSNSCGPKGGVDSTKINSGAIFDYKEYRKNIGIYNIFLL